MGGPLGRLLIERLNLFVNVMVPAGHRRRRPTAAEMHHYRQALPSARRRRASAIFPRAITASRQFLGRVEGELSGLTHLPVLFLWGDADFAFRKKELARWQEWFPGRETVVLAGAGHYLQSDAPEDFAAAIRSWFDALPGEPSPNPAVGRPT